MLITRDLPAWQCEDWRTVFFDQRDSVWKPAFERTLEVRVRLELS